MNHYKGLIKTAQFAKFCNVSKQTLIYYDKIGIFHPSYVDEKGYRYYSLSQYDTFVVISMLREIDTPLCEIKEYLEKKSANSFLDLMDKKQKEINKKIKELKALSHMIEERKNMTLYGMDLRNFEDVSIDSIPEERIIISDYVTSDEKVEHLKVISNFEKHLCQNSEQVFCIGVMIKKSKLLAGEYQGVMCFYAKTNEICENTVIKPQGLYATTFHKGYYDTIHLTYRRLIEYIQLNDYVVIGNAYEDVLLDFFTQVNEEEYLTRISIQVERS